MKPISVLLAATALCFAATPSLSDHDEHWNFLLRFASVPNNAGQNALSKARIEQLDTLRMLGEEFRCMPISVGAGVGVGLGAPDTSATTEERIASGRSGTYGNLYGFPSEFGYAEVYYVVMSCPREVEGQFEITPDLQIRR